MLKFLSKKFYSSIPILKYTSNLKRGKNVIYFATENDLKNNKEFDDIRSSRKLFLNDIKATKQTLFYAPEENPNYPCTERMLIVQSPLSDLNKLKTSVENAMNAFKGFKLKEIDLKFSQGFPLHHRKIVINSAILATHENLEKGSIPLQDFTPKEKTTDKEKPSDKKEEITTKTINIVEDSVILKNKSSINLWVNMAKGNLYTRNLANTRGSVGTPDFIQNEARILSQKFKDKIKMNVVKGNN